MPQLAVFESSSVKDSVPVPVKSSCSFKAGDKRLARLGQELLKSSRGDDYLAVSKENGSPRGGRVWLVLFDLNVQVIEEVALDEILGQLGRLLTLVEVPVSTSATPVVQRAPLEDDRTLLDWLVWFRRLPPSGLVKSRTDANPLEFQFFSLSSVLVITGIVACTALAAWGVAASANSVLQFAFYFFKLVLLAGLIAASLSIPFLAEWCRQATTFSVCYGVLFLLWRAASSSFLNIQICGDALLGSAILSLYALGVSRLSIRLQDTLGWSIVTNAFFAIVGVFLLMRLILFGVLN